MEPIDALKVIEGLRLDYLLLCEELNVGELSSAGARVDRPDRRSREPGARMQTRRHLDEISFGHGMGPDELKAHLERSMVLGDCSLCEWFGRSKRAPALTSNNDAI